MAKTKKAYGDATAMAGEFLAMEKLYRLGFQPALTVGKAKSIDIFVKNNKGKLFEISVKSVRGGGKWGATRGISRRGRGLGVRPELST